MSVFVKMCRNLAFGSRKGYDLKCLNHVGAIMTGKEYTCLLISDFNLDNFASYLANDTDPPGIIPAVAPYGQVVPSLMGDDLVWSQNQIDFAIIWTQPQGVIESFNHVLEFNNVAVDRVLQEVDDYCSLLMNLKDRLTSIFIPSWVIPSYLRGYGLLDMKNHIGIANMLMRMNLRLSDNFEKECKFYVLDIQKWIQHAGPKSFNPKLWYMAKIPFGNDVFSQAVMDVKAALTGISGKARKLIILDLDETLWGGIVGDDGWENITLGGHDHIGEAFADFQKALKALTNRGILLGIVSKNEESVALEAIKKHPEMVLRIKDFAGWKINWLDKAQNILDLVSDLNLGIDSAVFIDDNPVERARVREALPEVFVPEWPDEKMLYTKALLSLRCFDTPSVSPEDAKRAKMYVVERQRQALRNKIGSLDEWFGTLNIKVKIEELNDTNLPRTAQLLNKTNQMNLSTRRMTESELFSWASQDGHRLWTFRVSDKFGDSGLTGIVSIEAEKKKARIVDFILSCRVMGRKIEETMLHMVASYAKSLNCEELYAKYLPTPKNKPCLSFLETSGFEYVGDNIFSWKLNKDYQKPEHIRII